jgi:hypothetical protein
MNIFLRYLSIFIAVAIGLTGLFFGQAAQAAAIEIARELTPESATQQLAGWLQFATYALTGLGVLASLAVAGWFKLRAQIRAQGVQLADHEEQLAAAPPLPVQTPAQPPEAPPKAAL